MITLLCIFQVNCCMLLMLSRECPLLQSPQWRMMQNYWLVKWYHPFQPANVYANGQKSDPTIFRVRWYCQNGWPDIHEVEPLVKPYWETRCSLTLCDDLLLFDNHIIVPLALQKETIDKIHEGHQGIDQCRMRAKSAVWWPGMSKQLV